MDKYRVSFLKECGVVGKMACHAGLMVSLEQCEQYWNEMAIMKKDGKFKGYLEPIPVGIRLIEMDSL